MFFFKNVTGKHYKKEYLYDFVSINISSTFIETAYWHEDRSQVLDMSKTVAQITSKIVDITGNAATKAFVGRSVTRKNTKNGIVYTIGDTGYVLTSDEYKMFVAAGAIAQSSIFGGNSKKASKKEQAKKTNVSELISTEEEIAKDENRTDYIFKQEHKEIIANSDFLQNYPTPEFTINAPKRVGFFDRSADLSQKLTGFFDKLGRKGRDKIIDSMTK